MKRPETSPKRRSGLHKTAEPSPNRRSRHRGAWKASPKRKRWRPGSGKRYRNDDPAFHRDETVTRTLIRQRGNGKSVTEPEKSSAAIGGSVTETIIPDVRAGKTSPKRSLRFKCSNNPSPKRSSRATRGDDHSLLPGTIKSDATARAIAPGCNNHDTTSCHTCAVARRDHG